MSFVFRFYCLIVFIVEGRRGADEFVRLFVPSTFTFGGSIHLCRQDPGLHDQVETGFGTVNVLFSFSIAKIVSGIVR